MQQLRCAMKGAGQDLSAPQLSILWQYPRHMQTVRLSLDCAYAARKCLTQQCMQYDDAFPRRDLVGVHPQKQEGLFWGCCCVPAGRLHAEDFYDFARVADE